MDLHLYLLCHITWDDKLVIAELCKTYCKPEHEVTIYDLQSHQFHTRLDTSSTSVLFICSIFNIAQTLIIMPEQIWNHVVNKNVLYNPEYVLYFTL